MPRKGYKCITVSEEIHGDLKRRAQEANLSMLEFVEYLLAKERSDKKETQTTQSSR
ncbi:MAG: hypothetical protein NWE98_12115 [Candidatus Bathyarchaeota archaeon]|nr:hypothetical protein [Candidatus Bathyarchaeota archaeon]